MLKVFFPIFMADTKKIFCYTFIALLIAFQYSAFVLSWQLLHEGA